MSSLRPQQLPVDVGHGCAEADKGDLRSIRVFCEKAAALGHSDSGGLLGRIVVDPCADGGEGYRAAVQLQRQGKGVAVAGGQQLRFSGLSPVPHGTYRVDDIFGWKAALAVSMMLEGKIDKIILSRPAVEAGENLGFLPGDLKEKVDPYLRPLYDALYEMLPAEQVDKKIAIGEIEIAPLAFMRGRTLSNAFVILDEAQNTTPMQMKMFLTRLGENSRMVVNGDLSQVDLPRGTISGLRDALEILQGTPNISSVRFSATDVVRHGLVAKIVKAYEERSKKEYGDE